MRTWKVGAITSGILLIAIGLLWFIQQFYDLHLTKLFLFAWPVTCILLGAEILFLHFKRPDEKLRFHWLAILFLVIITTTSIGVNAVSAAAEELHFSLNQSTYELDQTIPIPADQAIEHVVITASDQDISVVGTDKQEVVIEGELHANIEDEVLLAKEVEDSLTTKQMGNTLHIEMDETDGWNELSEINGTLYISVPKTMDVEVNVSNGTIHMSDIAGQVSLTANAQITASNVTGTMIVNTPDSVQLNQCILLEGSNVTTSYGNLNWTIPNTASATIEASTAGELSGKLKHDGNKTKKDAAKINSNTVQIGEASAPVILHSDHGNITVSTSSVTP